MSRSSRPGRQAGLLDQLAAGGLLGRLAGDVAHAGRDLEDRPFVRRAVLRDEDAPTALPSASKTSGTTATAPGERTMSRSNRSPSGASNSATTTRQTWPWWTSRSPRRRKLGRWLGDRRAAAVSSDLHGRRSARRARAAPISSRNSGCGRSGRLLNSGWACVPTQNGWSAQLDELDQPAVGRRAAADEAGRLEAGPVVRVELVAVAVALADDRLAVGLGDLGARLEHGVVGAEAHRAALVGDVALVVHQVDHRVLRRRVELRRVGAGRGRARCGRTRSSSPAGRGTGRGTARPPRGRSGRRRSCPRSRGRRSRRGSPSRRGRRSRPAASRPSTSSAWIQSISTLAPWWKPACLRLSTTDR